MKYLQNCYYHLISYLFRNIKKQNTFLLIYNNVVIIKFFNHHELPIFELKSSKFWFISTFPSFYTNKSSFHFIPFHFYLKILITFIFINSNSIFSSFFCKHRQKMFIFAHIWIMDGGKGLKQFYIRKITIYMVFVIFQICVSIVNCFICLCICETYDAVNLSTHILVLQLTKFLFFATQTSLEVNVFAFEKKN